MHIVRRFVLILSLVSVSAFAALPFPSEKDRWMTVAAGEFRIYSNASERQTKDIATNLLRMREAIGKITRLNVHAPLPTYVFVFKNERSFAPYRDALFQRKNASISGAFLSGRNANFIVMDGGAGVGSEHVIYHELTHYFVRNTTPGLPLWLSEGLAEYYSSFSVNGDKINIGKPLVEHVQWLRVHSLLPLAQHFAVNQHSPEYSEGTRQGSFYAQSWALAHYFLTDDVRRKQLAQFLAKIGAGKSNDEAFRSAFGVDYAAVEQELRSYLRKPSMMFITYKLDELAVPELPGMRDATRDELLYALGLMYAWNRGTQSDAEALLNEATRINARNAEAYAVLGYLREMQKDAAGATALYEKAVAMGSQDATVYVMYGRSIVDRSRAVADVQRARQLFERATQLDANSASAWGGVCMTYVGEPGNPATGIAACETTLGLAASDEETALNLMHLYANNGRREDAKRVFDRLLVKSSNPEYVSDARETLLVADLREAERLYASGNVDDAILLIRPIASATTDDALRKHAQTIVAQYDSRIARLQETKAIDDIIGKANAGKMKDALAALDALLPKVTDEATRRELLKMRADFVRAK
jgi:tetratricopeptide (TPR) repeat protein